MTRDISIGLILLNQIWTSVFLDQSALEKDVSGILGEAKQQTVEVLFSRSLDQGFTVKQILHSVQAMCCPLMFLCFIQSFHPVVAMHLQGNYLSQRSPQSVPWVK